MKITEQFDVYECDGCGAIKTILKDAEAPLGYNGNVNEVSDWGGSSAEWYACKKICITKAVVNSLARERENR